jgi:hypothetical protein
VPLHQPTEEQARQRGELDWQASSFCGSIRSNGWACLPQPEAHLTSMTSSFTKSGASSMCRRLGQPFFEFRQFKKGASFNMEAVKQQVEAARKKFHSQ